MRLSGLMLAVVLSVCCGLPEVHAGPTLYPANEVPMYGHITKTPAMLEADRKFIDAILSTGMTREQGAEDAVGKGFRAMAKNDLRTAIHRFNQAWLLDSECYGAYWGFGVVLHVRDNLCNESFEMFDEALSLQVDDPYLLIDYGRICEECGLPDKAIPLFRKGLALDPSVRDGYIGLMLAYGRKGDFEKVQYWSEQGAGQGLLPSQSLEETKAIILDLLEAR